jgi:hypothetical protein
MTENGRRIAIVLVVLTAILGAVVAIQLVSAAPSTPPTPSLPPRGTDPAISPPDDLGVRAFKDFSVLPGAPTEPAGVPLQSRLWTIEGRWWAAMVEPVSREMRIYQLSLDGSTWSDTGVLLDERAGAMVDALWSGDQLYVASAVPGRSTSNGVRVTRFSREPGGRFVLDPNFPVRLTERGVSAVSVARDTSGRLWAAFVQDARVVVANSAGDEAVWDASRPVAGATTVGPSDVAALVTDGTGRIGLVWSDTAARSVLFAGREVRDAPDRWSPPEVAFEGLPLADEPISVAAGKDGSIFVVIETAVADAPGANQTEPGTVILSRDRAGTWRSALISRVEDRFGQPITLVDPAAAQVYVIATMPRHGGAIHLKRAEVDRLEFTAGRGLPVIADPSIPDIAFLTSTKQSVDAANGFVVLGFDSKTGLYWHALITSTAGSVTPSATPLASDRGSPAPSSPAPSASGPSTLLADNFDPWPLDAPIGNGWALGPADARGSLTAVADATSGRNARLLSAGPSAVRACKSFAPTAAGTLRAEVRVRLERIGAADAVITSLRDRTGEAVSLRFGQGGTFAYYSGQTKIRPAIPIRLETWYRSAVTVYLAARTYDWRLTRDDGSLVLKVRGVPFREAAATELSELCVQTSVGAGMGLRFDDVGVSR